MVVVGWGAVLMRNRCPSRETMYKAARYATVGDWRTGREQR